MFKMKPTNDEGKSPGSKATKYNFRKRTMNKNLSEISPKTSKKKRKIKKKMQKQAVQGKITKFFNEEELQRIEVLKVNNTTKFKNRSSKRIGYKSSGCKLKDKMFLTSIKRKKKYSGQDSLTGFKKRRLNYKNHPKTRKFIDELNLEEVFGENVKVCGYSRNEDVNQNVHNKEFIDVITIDVEVERVKNDVSKKKKDSLETKHDWLSIRTRGSPKVLYNLMKNLTPAQMKDIIDIRPGKSIIRYINEETKIENLDWCKYEIFEISNGGFGLLHLYSDDSSDDDIFERELDSKMDKLDQKVTLLKLIVEDLEFEFSNSLIDHPNSSKLKDIKAKYNGIIRNTDLSDFSYAIEDNSIHHESQYGNESSFDFKMFDIPKVDDKEKSAVGGFEDCLMKGLFRQVVEPDNSVRSFGNPFRISTSDMPKHRLDEPLSFSLGPEFDDFSVEEINQTNFFRAESEIDVLKEDIKPDIKDASIRVQPKREPSIACEIIYSSCTNNVKIPRIFLEYLAPGLKIDEPVIDAWADLLNFNERYKSANSPSRYFFKPILISVFDEYLSKSSPQRRASIFSNVEPERMKMIWRTNENEFDSGVFLMSHMDNYFGQSESK
nr:hypothetical protein [Tanacetum cinerariifolium]